LAKVGGGGRLRVEEELGEMINERLKREEEKKRNEGGKRRFKRCSAR
jgi:hypothetical protein